MTKAPNIHATAIVEASANVAATVRLAAFSYVGEAAVIEDEVIVGVGTRIMSTHQTPIKIEKGVDIGAGVIIAQGVTVSAGAIIGNGAVVTQNVPPNIILAPPPPIVKGYQFENGESIRPTVYTGHPPPKAPVDLGINGCQLWPIPSFSDMRGNLSALDFSNDLPFVPKRIFTVFDVPSEHSRGDHAHKECSQFLIALKGSVSLVLDDGENSVEVKLDRNDIGIFMPPMTWGTQYKYSTDSILLVLASHGYDSTDYIRKYNEYKSIKT